MWSWDITYLPTTVRGIRLYLCLVIDVCSRKVVTWHIAEREDPYCSGSGQQGWFERADQQGPKAAADPPLG